MVNRKVSVSVLLDAETLTQLESAAKNQDKTVSELGREYIKKGVEGATV